MAGDVVEYDYSVNGANPILAGRFADVNYLVESEPVARLRYRLLWPAGRALQHQVRNLELNPQVQPQGELVEYVWERANLAAPETEVETAAAADEYPTLYLSEFKTWQEVAAWAVPLYRVQGPLSHPCASRSNMAAGVSAARAATAGRLALRAG